MFPTLMNGQTILTRSCIAGGVFSRGKVNVQYIRLQQWRWCRFM